MFSARLSVLFAGAMLVFAVLSSGEPVESSVPAGAAPKVKAITDSLIGILGLYPGSKGVLLTQSVYGLPEGVVIESIFHRAVDSPEKFAAEWKRHAEGTQLLVGYRQKNAEGVWETRYKMVAMPQDYRRKSARIEFQKSVSRLNFAHAQALKSLKQAQSTYAAAKKSLDQVASSPYVLEARVAAIDSFTKDAPLFQKILMRTVEKPVAARDAILINLSDSTITGGGVVALIVLDDAVDAGFEILQEEGMLSEDQASVLRCATAVIKAINGVSSADDVISTLAAVQDAYGGLVEIGTIDRDSEADKIRVRINSNAQALDFELNLKGVQNEIIAAAPPKHPVPGNDWTSPTTGMEFVWIETLNMWVGKYEVTNEEYRKYKPEHNSGLYLDHSVNGPRQPAVQVNFDDAKTYAHWLSKELPEEWSYRLPTEEEWMMFAQCGDGREYPWGDNWPPRSGQAGNYADETAQKVFAWGTAIAGYDDGHAVTCDVEQSWANSWGLYGVGGNVWEACAAGSSNAKFGTWRGGSWNSYDQELLRCAYRSCLGGSYRSICLGFRLVLWR